MKHIYRSSLNTLNSTESYRNEYESNSVMRMAVCKASVYPKISGILQDFK